MNGYFYRENYLGPALEKARSLSSILFTVNGMENKYFYVPTHEDIEKGKKEFKESLYDETGCIVGLSLIEVMKAKPRYRTNQYK